MGVEQSGYTLHGLSFNVLPPSTTTETTSGGIFYIFKFFGMLSHPSFTYTDDGCTEKQKMITVRVDRHMLRKFKQKVSVRHSYYP